MRYVVGDITKAPENIIAHGCNAQGVMGAGVALAIRNAFPEAWKAYKRFSDQGGLHLGGVIWAVTHDSKFIANCITQEYYGRAKKQYVDYDAVGLCMGIINLYGNKDLAVALPKIGCGLAGGDWSIISKIIEEVLTNYKDVVIYVLDEKEICLNK